MKYLMSIILLGTFLTIQAESISQNNYAPGYIQLASNIQSGKNNPLDYTIIQDNTKKVTQDTNDKIIQFYKVKSNDKVRDALNFLQQKNISYFTTGAMGEGDCDGKMPCLHIQQDPLYRLDGMDCVTSVQFFLAVLNSDDLEDFKKNYIRMSYGAAKAVSFSSKEQTVSYLNRNNFTSVDFNRVNERNGFLSDVTATGEFKNKVKYIKRTIDHAEWFSYQSSPATIAAHVRILPQNIIYANTITKIFRDNYAKGFPKETIKLSYIPKSVFVNKENNTYNANEAIIEKLPTPSIVESVADDNKWSVQGTPIYKLIGSHILISHMGILYRQHFHQGQVIYQKIHCDKADGVKTCTVMPVSCQEKACTRVMFLAASNVYPRGYLYSYNAKNHTYACSDALHIPKGYKTLSTLAQQPLTCNRVLAMPFGDYLTMQQYGYVNVNNPALLGIHVEKINLTY